MTFVQLFSFIFRYLHLHICYLPVAVPQRGAESLEAGDVSRQFEDPQDPQDAEDLRGLGDVLERVLGGELVQDQRHEEREDPQQVNHVQEREHERKLKIDIEFEEGADS